MDTTGARKTYRGNCHCGRFVFELSTAEPITELYNCNCSICVKKGYLWRFVGADDVFTVVQGDDALAEYTFGKGVLIHKFCPRCATGVLGTMTDGPPGMQIALNARAIQGLQTNEIQWTDFDGLSLGEPYDPPKHRGPLPTGTVDGGIGKLYTGSCHCGDVTVAVVTEPLDENYPKKIARCNCSLCERNAFLWIYPPRDRVVLNGAEGSIGRYAPITGFMDRTFCRRCGVGLTNEPVPQSEEQLARLSDEDREMVDRMSRGHSVNVRALHGVDLAALKLYDLDWAARDPQYVNP